MVAKGYEITNIVEALRVGKGLAAGDFDDGAWARARVAHIERYWSGEDAPQGRRAEARVAWDARGFTVRFDCRQEEPLVVSSAPLLEGKTMQLWDRDVCEVFITPETEDIQHYYEFEVAPTGEWIDLALTVTKDGRDTQWDFRSGMTAASGFSSSSGSGSAFGRLCVPRGLVGDGASMVVSTRHSAAAGSAASSSPVAAIRPDARLKTNLRWAPTPCAPRD